ncbi:TPA: hypothetical protein NPM51_000475 [Enterobacter hormaechei]|nr:hypothetical protein [Enterobacter hormaechei]MCM7231435.1 hypothetical protein [Enterobacter hormaechei]HAS1181990.1 hypothetical protein [Enterobacter cloacae]HCI5160173.1 hypothetical protein [Enterobacter hormaechei]HEM8780663.1 hypothetical protein [Enterobacter hormaechei]
MIFNGEMVRAILDGRKTQTRRIMKVQPSDGFHPTHNGYDLDLNAHWYTPGVVDKNGYLQPAKKDVFGVADENEGYTCPFGAVGDRIWVRETWAEAGAGAPDLKLYRADYPEHVPTHYENVPPADEIRWTPSIHMPRWASRITLEITSVRVEKLDKISEEDAIAEGMQGVICPCCKDDPDYSTTQYDPVTLAAVDEVPCQYCESNRSKFFALWDSIYGEANHCMGDWVWVIEFKVVPNVQDNPA